MCNTTELRTKLYSTNRKAPPAYQPPSISSFVNRFTTTLLIDFFILTTVRYGQSISDIQYNIVSKQQQQLNTCQARAEPPRYARLLPLHSLPVSLRLLHLRPPNKPKRRPPTVLMSQKLKGTKHSPPFIYRTARYSVTPSRRPWRRNTDAHMTPSRTKPNVLKM